VVREESNTDPENSPDYKCAAFLSQFHIFFTKHSRVDGNETTSDEKSEDMAQTNESDEGTEKSRLARNVNTTSTLFR
jgi:hypothetical protein